MSEYFSVGDELLIRLGGKPFTLTAIPAIKDSDFCHDCFLYRFCSSFKGNSPLSRMCYTTIFKEAKNDRF